MKTMMLVDSEKSSSEEKELDKMLESESELAPNYTGGGGGLIEAALSIFVIVDW